MQSYVQAYAQSSDFGQNPDFPFCELHEQPRVLYMPKQNEFLACLPNAL